MLTPMTPSELHRHKSMGLYKTQAQMEKDTERRRKGPPVKSTFTRPMTDTQLPAHTEILPPIEFEIQGYDDV